MHKLKDAYILWFQYYQILPKPHRRTLGARVDLLFIESIEAVATAAFLVKAEKLPYVRLAMRKVDTIKVLLQILWETKSLEDKQYIALSEKVDVVGRNLGGWHNQLVKSLDVTRDKQNSPTQENKVAGKK
ncbi:MAG TPA: four helix bundle protein [Candidatus Paceibacterota bacterium]